MNEGYVYIQPFLTPNVSEFLYKYLWELPQDEWYHSSWNFSDLSSPLFPTNIRYTDAAKVRMECECDVSSSKCFFSHLIPFLFIFIFIFLMIRKKFKRRRERWQTHVQKANSHFHFSALTRDHNPDQNMMTSLLSILLIPSFQVKSFVSSHLLCVLFLSRRHKTSLHHGIRYFISLCQYVM